MPVFYIVPLFDSEFYLVLVTGFIRYLYSIFATLAKRFGLGGFFDSLAIDGDFLNAILVLEP